MLTLNGQSGVPVYLGSANAEDIASCIQVWREETIRVPSLKNDHEEADDRIFYHLKHSIKRDGFQKVVIASLTQLFLLTQMFSFVLSTITIDGCIVT